MENYILNLNMNLNTLIIDIFDKKALQSAD